MQCEEPSACLVNALSDEVCREGLLLVDEVTILEWIVYLSIRHGT